jgi:hypothetical protein
MLILKRPDDVGRFFDAFLDGPQLRLKLYNQAFNLNSVHDFSFAFSAS